METGRVRKLRKLNGLEIYEYVAPKSPSEKFRFMTRCLQRAA